MAIIVSADGPPVAFLEERAQLFDDHQGSQNYSRFDIYSDCVVIGSQFYLAKSAANDNTI